MIGSTAGNLHKNQNRITDELSASGHSVKCIFRAPSDQRNIMKEIREFEPELLITEDLEGFEMCTLTDAVSYNLIHCRQLHILFSGELNNERYLAKQLSLLMTFVCADPARVETLTAKYPDLPEITSATDIPEDIPAEVARITAGNFRTSSID